ncbi:MAG TPA: division/cell wall cluster transcriptional repressor MraZ [Acidobacteriota bacterium]|nr:division/cell wall cluster transcriptional repressor MraZ [Acidobacteriota bacterium]
MTGLYGKFQTTLDNKGRFAIPAKLRAATGPDGTRLLEGELVLTKGLEGCLSIYPAVEWEEIQRRFSSLNFTQKDFRFFSRRFYSAAGVVTPDRNGRILIPSHLVTEARLKRELLVIGVNRWVEIWDPDRFAYYLEQFAGSYEEVAERLYTGHDQRSE